MDILDLDQYKLEKELDEIAWLLCVSTDMFKIIVADMYLKGWNDCQEGKKNSYEKMKKLRDSLENV